MVGGGDPSTWNIGSVGPRWSEIADFQPMFARSTSFVTPSKKSSFITNSKTTTRFQMSLTWSPYLPWEWLQLETSIWHTNWPLAVIMKKCNIRSKGSWWRPLPLPLPSPSGWTSNAEAIHQLRPNPQPQHNQRLGKCISSSYELERMHNLHRIKC